VIREWQCQERHPEVSIDQSPLSKALGIVVFVPRLA
jgi:hypothetical protein